MQWIKRILPAPVLRFARRVRERYFDVYAKKSYSQEGEDMLLDRYFERRPSGFYVDVGAHHPKRFSNTYRLYLRGWRGINIDANPGSMALFRKIRPRDVNIEAAVSSVRQELTYYVFNEPALNTLDPDLALSRAGGVYSIQDEVKIVTAPLWQLLEQHVPPNTKIDLLTVDVEGLDYDVLQSNDWDRYTPEFILVESLETATLEQTNSDPVAQLLFGHRYRMIAKTMSTGLFQWAGADRLPGERAVS